MSYRKGYCTSKFLIKLLLILTTIAWMIYPTGDISTLNIVKVPALFVIAILIILNYRYASIKFRAPLLVLTTMLILGLINVYGRIDMELIVGLAYFFLFTFLIVISDALRIDKSIKRYIYICALISIATSTYYAYSPIAHWTGRAFIDYLTLGMYNSNYAGILLFAIGATFIVACPKNNWFQGLLNYSIYGWNCYLIFETNCRSAFVAAILVPLASIFLLKYRIKKFIILATLLLPIVFVPFYMKLAENTKVTDEELMGKGVVSGRQRVYHEYFDTVNFEEILLGKFGSSGVPNQHNGPLAVFTAFGVFGFAAFGYILVKKLFQDNEYATSIDAKFGIYAILACIIESCGEAALFSGSFPAFIYVYLFFVLAGSDNKRDVLTTTIDNERQCYARGIELR